MQAEHIRQLQEELAAALSASMAQIEATTEAVLAERLMAVEASGLRHALAVERAARIAEDRVMHFPINTHSPLVGQQALSRQHICSQCQTNSGAPIHEDEACLSPYNSTKSTIGTVDSGVSGMVH